MKRFAQIALLVLMIALSLTLTVLPCFAEGAPEEEVTTEAESTIGFNIDFARFTNSLQYMWKGMLCIFIVIGVIILVTFVLNKVVNGIVDAKAAKKNGSDEEA